MSALKEELRVLLDQLPEERLREVRDPLKVVLGGPEELTDQERREMRGFDEASTKMGRR